MRTSLLCKINQAPVLMSNWGTKSCQFFFWSQSCLCVLLHVRMLKSMFLNHQNVCGTECTSLGSKCGIQQGANGWTATMLSLSPGTVAHVRNTIAEKTILKFFANNRQAGLCLLPILFTLSKPGKGSGHKQSFWS